MSDASASQRLLELLLAPGGPLDPERAPGWFEWAKLKAPFPWFGGKRRAASLIWPRLGEVVNYVEPFYGSGAVLLGRPHEPRVETINDVDGMVVNFWRALRADPEAVAAACDWPVNEADLHARHRYLARVKRVISARCEADPFYSNATVAGWWVWGLSAWIGSGWCEDGGLRRQAPDIGARGPGGNAGRGPHSKAMRTKLPSLGATSKGGPGNDGSKGVNGVGVRRQLPFLAGGNVGEPCVGQGTNNHGTRSALYEIFEALARRLRYVRVTCGDFERILTPAVTWKHGLTGVVLDPPYEGFDNLYGTEPVSARVRAWCIENGARKDLRIALCGYDGEHNELEALGWTVEAWKAQGGYSNQSDGENENSKKERIWFSPACIKNVDATGQSAFSW
jgi:hypothetical protein